MPIMKIRKGLKKFIIGYGLLGVIMCVTLLVQCDCPPKVPQVDSTPPSVCLILSGPNMSKVVCDGDPPATVILDKTQSYKLAAFAVDGNGGIRRVMITGGTTVSCKDPNSSIASMTFYDYYAQEPDNPTDPPVGTQVPAFRFVQMDLAERGWTPLCQKPFVFVSASGSFMAHAENYRDGTASTPSISFTVE